MLRHDCKPVIFLINSGGYSSERCYLGKSSRYNDIANWPTPTRRRCPGRTPRRGRPSSGRR
jgi:hypothetical protein